MSCQGDRKKSMTFDPKPTCTFHKMVTTKLEGRPVSIINYTRACKLGLVSLPFNCLDFLCWVFGKLLRSITFIQFQNMFTTEKSWKR